MIARSPLRLAGFLCLLIFGSADAAIRLGHKGSYFGLPSYRPAGGVWTTMLRTAFNEPLSVPDSRYDPIAFSLERAAISPKDFSAFSDKNQEILAFQAEAMMKDEIGLAAATALAKLKNLHPDSIDSEQALSIQDDLALIAGDLRPYVPSNIAAAADIGLDIIDSEAGGHRLIDPAGRQLIQLAISLKKTPNAVPLLIDELGPLKPAKFQSPPVLRAALRRNRVVHAAQFTLGTAWAAALPWQMTGSIESGLLAAGVGLAASIPLINHLGQGTGVKDARPTDSNEQEGVTESQRLLTRGGVERPVEFEVTEVDLALSYGNIRKGWRILMGSRFFSAPESIRAGLVAHETSHLVHGESAADPIYWQAIFAPGLTWAAGVIVSWVLAFVGWRAFPSWWILAFSSVLSGVALVPLFFAAVSNYYRGRHLKEFRSDWYAAWLTHPAWMKAALGLFVHRDAITTAIAAGKGVKLEDDSMTHPLLEDRLEAIDSYAAGKPRLPKPLTTIEMIRRLFAWQIKSIYLRLRSYLPL